MTRRMNWTDEQQRRWLTALLDKLRACKPGETYPLDVVERELILNALADGERVEDSK